MIFFVNSLLIRLVCDELRRTCAGMTEKMFVQKLESSPTPPLLMDIFCNGLFSLVHTDTQSALDLPYRKIFFIFALCTALTPTQRKALYSKRDCDAFKAEINLVNLFYAGGSSSYLHVI